MPPENAITEIIRRKGSVTVAEYMQLCISHYYATRDPFGATGDFTTAPEISQIFGELLGAWLMHQWQAGVAGKAILCEAGPGRGTLMRDMLRVIKDSLFEHHITVHLIENSPVLRHLQQQNLARMHTDITWHDAFDTLPKEPMFFVANEFFDAMPVRQYVGVTERRVVYHKENLVFAPEGGVTRETSPISMDMMEKIADHICRYGGAALIIDYGYEGTGYKDTLQALRHHAFVSPLLEPGEADMTAHVDFTTLKQAAKRAGGYVHGTVTQGAFLKSLGAELRAAALSRKATGEQQKNIVSGLERITAPHQMGELFRVMAVTGGAETPVGF